MKEHWRMLGVAFTVPEALSQQAALPYAPLDCFPRKQGSLGHAQYITILRPIRYIELATDYCNDAEFDLQN
jgi:hypothetical protein